MRHTIVASIIVLWIGWELWGVDRHAEQARAQQIPATVKPLMLADGLIALSSDTAEGFQQVAVIDSRSRSMCVYHVEHKTGKITLKSARSLSADLEIEEFQTDSPLPREVRAILNQR